MPFFKDLFAGLEADKIEELQERLAIVEHKIKFMEKIPVACLNLQNIPNVQLTEELLNAGGRIETDPNEAVFILYYQEGKDLSGLMSKVTSVINPEWEAVKNNRIILINDDVNRSRTAENAVSLIEDMAEMIHPGHFIFGHEGDKWIRFNL